MKRPSAAVCAVLGVLVCLSGTGAVAQSVAPVVPAAPASQPGEPNAAAHAMPAIPAPAAVPAAPEPNEPGTATFVVTPELLQARKKQVTEAQDLDPDLKAALTDIYDKALEQLKLADLLAARKKQYSQGVKSAPADLESIRKALSQPAAPIPVPAGGLTLTQAEQALTEASLALEEARKKADGLENEPQRRAARRGRIAEESNTARQQLEEIKTRLAAVGEQQPAALAQANRVLLRLQQRVLNNRLEADTAELLFYDATNDLVTTQRDLAAREWVAAQKLVEARQQKVAELRQQAAEAAKKEAIQAKEDSRYAPPLVRTIAEENSRLAHQQAEVTTQIEGITKYAEAVSAKLAAVQRDFGDLRRKVETAGTVTDAMGRLLLGRRGKLPDTRENQRQMRGRLSELSLAQFHAMDYDQQWSDLGNPQEQAEAVLDAAKPPLSTVERASLRSELVERLQARRKMLRTISDLYWDYAAKLADLDTNERTYVRTVNEYADFIDANLLWVKSNRTIELLDLHQVARAFEWLVSPANWQQIAGALWTDLRGNILTYVLLVLVVVAAIVFHTGMHQRIEAIAEKIPDVRTDSFLLTLRALTLTVLLAATWPVLLLLLYRRLTVAAPDGDFARALASGLGRLAYVVFVLSFVQHLALPYGLAHDHFRLRQEPLTFLRRHLRWFTILIVPLVLVLEIMHAQQTNDQWYGTVGRLFFMAGLFAFAVFLLLVLRPASPLVESALKQGRGGWLERLRYMWYPLCVLLPIAFAVLAGMGYLYGARYLEQKLMDTVALILLALLLRAIFVRWLMVAQRRLAVLERRKRLAAEAKAEETKTDPAPADPGETAEAKNQPEQTIFQMSRQTRQLIGVVTGVFVVVGIWYIWNDVLPAFAALGKYPLWQMGPAEVITLGSVATALLVAVLTVGVARNVPGLLEIVILRRLPLDRGVRFAIITICRYVLAIVGAVIAFDQIGIGWSKVQWLVAAMTVGLGFGLQEIFANFVSGLIILFEQPVRVDDVVTVGDVTGRVTKIKIRATTIRKWDQRELIMPNKEFITGRLINWTLSDTILRQDFLIGVAYGSDIAKTERLLHEIAAANPMVMKEPKPVVLFKRFGDSSLEFELRVFICDMDHYLPVWHNINCAIDAAFRRAGIEIAFPQRDIHIRSISTDHPVPVDLRDLRK